MTGRKSRVVRKGGRLTFENRAASEGSEMDSLNVKERNLFMSGKKLVAIIRLVTFLFDCRNSSASFVSQS